MSETAQSETGQSRGRVKRWPYLLPLVGVLVLAALFGKRLLDVEHGADPSLIPTVLLDTPAPKFDLAPLPGHGDGLRSDDFKGKVVLVNFFGSWCIACVAEHPVLMEIAKTGELPIEGIDWRDESDKVLPWLERRGDPYDKIGQDPNGRAVIDFGVVAAPESFLIDGNGVIRYKEPGPITEEIWRKKIEPLVAQLKKQ